MTVLVPPALVAVQVRVRSRVSSVSVTGSQSSVVLNELPDWASVTVWVTVTSRWNHPVPSATGSIVRAMPGADSSTIEKPLRASTCTPPSST